jgi:hypothetical protein
MFDLLPVVDFAAVWFVSFPQVCSRAGLAAVWREDPGYLKAELMAWLPKKEQWRLEQMWPTLLQQATAATAAAAGGGGDGSGEVADAGGRKKRRKVKSNEGGVGGGVMLKQKTNKGKVVA